MLISTALHLTITLPGFLTSQPRGRPSRDQARHAARRSGAPSAPRHGRGRGRSGRCLTGPDEPAGGVGDVARIGRAEASREAADAGAADLPKLVVNISERTDSRAWVRR